jgi:ribosomal protein S18 acetylase RimI-like enzyme
VSAAGRESLRPERESDLPFLERLYASTRAEELMLVDWDDARKASFCSQQFAAQRGWYKESYPAAEWGIVEVDGTPAGRLYVEERADEIRIVDVALVPEARGRGLGGALVARVLERGRAAGKPVTIHVERFNRALALYERLGFRLREDRGVHLFLEWRGEACSTS